ncbi:hypothetical protein FPZ12_027385 [Amycolatopsis acidicola]|uniref:Uncharacterized protein n=1 Tax=Amycolatopsis acidicola TaxID=2596893 RepID=A0A5N0UWJ5_9PSEU|nr:hypothetical protein [Amycolatopsis acidicola]KAA9156571.1 hypothetical protein FPZ12_027385 [Amycolatopsis acidicola]
MRQSLVTVTAALIVGSGLVAGSATAYTAEIPAQSSPQPMETTVPKCLHDKEDKGIFGGFNWSSQHSIVEIGSVLWRKDKRERRLRLVGRRCGLRGGRRSIGATSGSVSGG